MMKDIETLRKELTAAHEAAKEAGDGYVIGLDRRLEHHMPEQTIIEFCKLYGIDLYEEEECEELDRKEYGIEVEEPEAVEEPVECSPMRTWARENGLEAVYDQYIDHCMDIADECAAEGYPSTGSNYELRVERIREYYPELFGDED